MNNSIKYIVLAITFCLCACEADPDEGLPSFDNTLPLYVQLSSTSNIEADEGDDVPIRIEIPEVIYNDVNVQWEVTGDISASGSVTITEGNLTADAMVSIPDDSQVTGGGSAVFTLTSVDNGLTLGRQNASTSVISTNLTWVDND
ncbi:MAG: hypothetical protein DHS20C17_01580 [Cyclobacteriaceae bacterium]|nr:MAG: hypothetical protein DHS20C17_01580 [Cyclobacteriaceae bacterium]